ncbi:MAG TPA: hypothetical protein PLU30_14990 [Verrucomicrobiae bacterium]|nr:hypothetical protein [Verrucomicrobiae bacterium]
MHLPHTIISLLFGGVFALSPVAGQHAGSGLGGMFDPDLLDPPDKPFSYFAWPTDMLGAWGAPAGVEVTPEGYIWTGFGELMFFTGLPPVPVSARIRTLHKGCLPAVEYDLAQNGVRYSFRLFAADVGGALKGVPVSFAMVTVTNTLDAEPRAAYLSAGWRYRSPVNTLHTAAGDYRFGQRGGSIPAHLTKDLGSFKPSCQLTWADDAVRRDGRMLFTFPTDPAPSRRALALEDWGLHMRRYFSGEIEGDPNPRHTQDPHTPVGIVTYCIQLKPGQGQTLTFKLPLVPSPDDSPEARQVRDADPPRLFAEMVAFWEKWIIAKPPLRFPEHKVQEYLLANTINNLLTIDLVGDDLIVNVNKFHYHNWYCGANTTEMSRAFEYMGLLDVARRAFLFFFSKQGPDGGFRLEQNPNALYWEFFGYNLWGWGRHYQLTRDREFLEHVYPGVVKAMAWHETITGKDPLGLFPPATVADDAYLKDCRQTGQHLWGLIGLRNAVCMAKEMGKAEDVARFEAQERRFRAAFDKLLDRQTAKTGGYIPPALERTVAGNDWDNLRTLHPEILFDPADPRVEATLRTVRGRYQEGLLAYTWPAAIGKRGDEFVFNERPGLHYWQTPNNAQVSLVRGTAWDQEWAVKELYAMLLHSTSTHLPAEFGTIPWSTRGYSHVFNITPQCTSSANVIQLLRNMLVREQGADLYLLSAISPEWVQSGRSIEVRDEPSSFGPISFTAEAARDQLTIRLPEKYRQSPRRLLVRVPWFYSIGRATLDGKAIDAKDGHFAVPVTGKELILFGRIKPDGPRLSYERAVADYKAEYRRRYEEFVRRGVE